MVNEIKLKTRESKKGVQNGLEEELAKLQGKLGLGLDLRVVWVPNVEENLSGEVKNGNIFIYESDEGKALKTLGHELIDFCVSQAIEPYKEVSNRLIRMINEDAYKRKENIVEALSRLIVFL